MTVEDLELFGVQLGSGGEGIDGSCPIVIPNIPGIEIDIGSIGDLFVLSGFIDAFLEFINSLINFLLTCINDCYYNGTPMLDIRDFFDIAGINIGDFEDLQSFVDDADAFAQAVEDWLNKPGLGTQINTFLQVHLAPFIKGLELVCMLLAWFFECILGSSLAILSLFFEKDENGDPDFENARSFDDLGDIAGDIAATVVVAAEKLEKCFDLEFPWPFPFDWFCEWIFPFFKYVLPRVCENEEDTVCIPLEDLEAALDLIDFSLELPSIGLDLSCLLKNLIPIPDFEFDMKSLILLMLRFNLCSKDENGDYLSDPTDQPLIPQDHDSNDFSVDINFLAQFLGIVIKVPMMLFDKYISRYVCLVRDLLKGFQFDFDFDADIFELTKALFDFGLEDIFNEIKNSLKGMLPDIDWNLVEEIQVLEGWEAAMEKMIEDIPWLCIVNCFMLGALKDLIGLVFSPLISLFELLQDVVGLIESTLEVAIEVLTNFIAALISFEFSPFPNLEIEYTGFPLLDLANILVALLGIFAPPVYQAIALVFVLEPGDNQWCLNVPNLVEFFECALNEADL